MRNLKKFLALVLAMMMVLSMMVTVNAATSFVDDDQISDTYSEAVYALSELKILQGDAGTGNFRPTSNIKRDEFATILYRLLHKDLDGEQVGIYDDYGYFTDVTADKWFAGYVNYVANSQVLMGRGGDIYDPETNVTGYEVLVTLLRALGYNQNNEYSGKDWQLTTARKAAELGITRNINETTLGRAATREEVAEMVYQAMRLNRAIYIFDNYIPSQAPLVGLTSSETTYNAWGVPTDRYTYTWGLVPSNNTGRFSVAYTPVYTATWAEAECEVTDVVSGGEDFWANVFTNGYIPTSATNPTPLTGSINKNYQPGVKVEAKETVDEIGATGRLTRIYENPDFISTDPESAANPGYIIVYVDDLLAQVTDVTKAKFDRAEHLSQAATITLEVYDGHINAGEVTSTTVTLERDDEENYEYVKGDYVIINAKQSNRDGHDNYGRVYSDGFNGNLYGFAHVEIIPGVAESFIGKQTLIIKNSDEHEVNGETISDDHRFVLNEITNNGRDMSNNYRWFVDQYGYLIGAVVPTTEADYGVVTDIQWINQRRDGYALADLILMNGETLEDVEITEISLYDDGDLEDYTPVYGLGDEALTKEGDEIYITTSSKTNAAAAETFVENTLFRISLDEDGETATLVEMESGVFDITAKNPVFDATSGDADDDIRVNNGTMFLIRSGSAAKGWAFKAVTGFKYEDYVGATVYYVNVDGDDYVEFALILGDPVTTVDDDEGLLYVKNGSYTYKSGTYTLKGVNYNGEEVDMTTKDPKIVEYLTDNIGGLFYVILSDGKNIDGIVMISGDYNPYEFADDCWAEYVDGDDITLTKDVIKWNNGVDDMYINIDEATEILYNERLIGWNELNEYLLKGYNVYVVYDDDNVAAVIYVTDEDVTGTKTIIYTTEDGDIMDTVEDDVAAGETVTATEEVSDEIDVKGTLIIGEDAKVTEDGDITVKEGGELIVNGTVEEDAEITVEEGGELVVNGTVEKDATITIEEGGSLTVNGTIEEGADITVRSLDAVTMGKDAEPNEAIKYEPVQDDGETPAENIELKKSEIPAKTIIKVDASQIEDTGTEVDNDHIMGNYDVPIIVVNFGTAKKDQYFVAVVKGPSNSSVEYREYSGKLANDISIWTLCPKYSEDLKTSGSDWTTSAAGARTAGYYTLEIYVSDSELVGTSPTLSEDDLVFSGGFTVESGDVQ